MVACRTLGIVRPRNDDMNMIREFEDQNGDYGSETNEAWMIYHGNTDWTIYCIYFTHSVFFWYLGATPFEHSWIWRKEKWLGWVGLFVCIRVRPRALVVGHVWHIHTFLSLAHLGPTARFDMTSVMVY
jgi:hypothetical protein